MAKNLILHILTDLIGEYVEGLNTENLQMAVFSGQIEFNNLSLKAGALNKFDLPVTITKGSLKSLHVEIPWTNLGTMSH
jgi:hypothetical protein